MRRSRPKNSEKGALELIEEAFHLLRLAPASLLAVYCLGTLPFVLGLLFFLADMSKSYYASDHLGQAALLLSLLYIWMKCWQTVFTVRVKARAGNVTTGRWTFRRVLRMAAIQTAIQPSSLLLLPIASSLIVPFGWTYAFYHNVSAIADGTDGDLKSVLSRAWHQTKLWPRQNHRLILVLSAFGFFVFLNIQSISLTLPQLIKMITGKENVFTLSVFYLFNSTFLASVLALSYLCINPLIKTVYALRCFYGESYRTGEDLTAELNVVRASGRTILVLLLLALSIPCLADTNKPEVSPGNKSTAAKKVPHEKLDTSIKEVLTQPEYSWRMPRERLFGEREGWLFDFIRTAAETIERWVKGAARWIEKVLDRIAEAIEKIMNRVFPKRKARRSAEGRDFSVGRVHALIFLLLAAALSVLALALLRMWKRRRRSAHIEAAPEPAGPDLKAEDTQPDELPPDEWLTLARKMMEKGESRLALRAMYLASLAFLAEQEMLTLAKFKSCRDYERELVRRAHSRPETLSMFSENISVFERIWYGLHAGTKTIVDRFMFNCKRMRVTSEE